MMNKTRYAFFFSFLLKLKNSKEKAREPAEELGDFILFYLIWNFCTSTSSISQADGVYGNWTVIFFGVLLWMNFG